MILIKTYKNFFSKLREFCGGMKKASDLTQKSLKLDIYSDHERCALYFRYRLRRSHEPPRARTALPGLSTRYFRQVRELHCV